MSTPRVIVIGGGITGLSLAVTLREEARRLGERLDLVVLERDRVAGGHARTIESGGFVV
jgi:oxygen-dependent protoporphyrinogen oxidase